MKPTKYCDDCNRLHWPHNCPEYARAKLESNTNSKEGEDG